MSVALWSELELEVAADMIALDYDPYNPEDVAAYWQGLLDG